MMDTLFFFFNSWLLNVLLTLAMILVVVGTMVWLVEMRRNSEFPRNPVRGIGQGIWWASTTMTGVGYGDTVPRSTPGRLLGVVWMFIGVLMISSFTATIASSLTSENIRSHVSGVGDLGRLKVGAVHGENPLTLLRDQGIIAQEYDTLDHALKALADGDLDAMVHDRPLIQYQLHNDPDLASAVGLSNITVRKEEYGIAIGIPADPNQRNTLVDEINASLIRVKSSGRYDKIVGQYLGL
jgi:ABC-type amino acid transport substrate-binding protein